MNTGQRIALVAAALVILVGAFVLAQGSDDEGGEEQTRAATEPVTTEPTGGAQAPAGDSETSTGSGGATAPAEPGADTTEAETSEAAPAAPAADVVRIRDGEPVGGVQTLTYRSGDTVRIRFTSDAPEEVHVHGYDREAEVPAGGSTTLSFKADAEGAFEIESHETGTLLARLEVRP